MEIIAMGDAALMDGFALLGIQTYVGQSNEVINQVLQDLKHNKKRALVFVQQDLMDADIPMLSRLRNGGGSILICAIPQLDQARNFRPEVEQLIGRVMGQHMLEGSHER